MQEADREMGQGVFRLSPPVSCDTLDVSARQGSQVCITALSLDLTLRCALGDLDNIVY